MEGKRVTLIVSDLHMGDGKAGDDFVNDRHQFAQFVHTQAATPEGRAGAIELIINGDFLEFVQVYPEAYNLDPPNYWCSEEESLAKLEHILCGHAKVFAALKDFQRNQNRVTLFAGNHDVDLYWPAVQARVREKAGDVNIELGEVWYKRYGGRLRISHGHLFTTIDPANSFNEWRNPRLRQPDDTLPPRLEMCSGTLFVVRFVNLLENKYPFADNLHPASALANVLLREDRWGLTVVGWMLTQFAGRFRKATLSSKGATTFNVGTHLLRAIKVLPKVQEGIASLYREVLHQPDVSSHQVTRLLDSEAAILAFVERLFRADVSWERWLAILDLTRPGVLGKTSAARTLKIGQAALIDVRQKCIEIARNAWRDGAEIVVFGHTHLPQQCSEGHHRYYNPGSWTRYVDAGQAGTLTLKDLEREDTFPFELNCARIEDTGSYTLQSELICIDKGQGSSY
jgi:UDP-2,3-diacylglucosamine pyrophosphatase LpxH